MKKKAKKTEFFPVDVLAAKVKIPAWELAALRQAMNWADGKQVSEQAFREALDRLRTRPQGGGSLGGKK